MARPVGAADRKPRARAKPHAHDLLLACSGGAPENFDAWVAALRQSSTVTNEAVREPLLDAALLLRTSIVLTQRKLLRGEAIGTEERRQISVWTKQLPAVLMDLGVLVRDVVEDPELPSFL